MQILYIFILMACAGFFNACMDTIKDHYSKSIFTKWPGYFGPLAWKNKYKDYDFTKGPRFFLSTTLLIWLTSGWHLFKLLMLACFFVSLVLAVNYCALQPIKPIASLMMFIFFWAVFQFVFETTYNLLG